MEKSKADLHIAFNLEQRFAKSDISWFYNFVKLLCVGPVGNICHSLTCATTTSSHGSFATKGRPAFIFLLHEICCVLQACLHLLVTSRGVCNTKPLKEKFGVEVIGRFVDSFPSEGQSVVNSLVLRFSTSRILFDQGARNIGVQDDVLKLFFVTALVKNRSFRS